MQVEATIQVEGLELFSARQKAYALAHLAHIGARPAHSGVFGVDRNSFADLEEYVLLELAEFRRRMGWSVQICDPAKDPADKTRELRLVTTTGAKLVFVPVKIKKSDRG